MFTIKNINFRKVLNTHIVFTNEFVIELEEGAIGAASSPQGETISIYEDTKIIIDPLSIIKKIERDGYIGKRIDQTNIDEYIETNIALFGRNNAYSLSLAFYKATTVKCGLYDLFNKPQGKLTPPRICCNILNGGFHAYTNPVLSDFQEYILVARSNDIEAMIADHKEIQKLVKERLVKEKKAVVAGNSVHRFKTADNRECIDFILRIREDLGLSDRYDLMIDASGGDLRTDAGYYLSITDNQRYSSEGFLRYWMDLIKEYDLSFLEDPFCETDYEAWCELTASQRTCKIIGDNIYSSNAERIVQGAASQYTHGVVIKPNQSGTVTMVRRAIQHAQDAGQIVITSHRSISTEETFISTLTCMYRVPFIKIGPLMTDYSSVMRLNEIIRLTG